MGRTSSSQFEAFALSHRGLVRQKNEDRVQVVPLESAHGKQALLAVLADGVGGHLAGEVASRIATDTIISEISSTYPATDVRAQLEQAILTANQAILEDIQNHPERTGMGTTCVCALMVGKKLYTAHLGDSRLYLFRKHSLHQLTQDHTLYEDLIKLHGDRLPENDRNHPMAHVLSRYLGSPHVLEIDHTILGFENQAESLKLHAGDLLLLCSDGISDLVSYEEIINILSACKGRKCAQSLVLRALENGGHDNASVIVIRIP